MAIFRGQETMKKQEMAAKQEAGNKPKAHTSYNPVAQERPRRRPRRRH